MKTLLVVLLSLSAIFCSAQSRERLKEKKFNPSSFEEFRIEIKRSKKDSISRYPYDSPLFIDARGDTGKLGFALVGANIEYHRILSPKPLAPYLTSKAEEFGYYDYNPGQRMVVIIKQCWISEAIVKPATYGRSMLVGPLDYMSYCYFNADCFQLKNDSCTYIGNIDTVYSLRKWIANGADDLFSKTLKEISRQSLSLFSTGKKASRSFSLEQVRSAYLSEVQPEVSLNKKTQRGIFLSYEDFLANKTSYPDFKTKNEKGFEYLSTDGVDDSVLDKAWGYFDGADYYMHINENYYRMVRSGNTFDVIGPRNIIQIYSKKDKIINSTITAFFNGLASAGLDLMMMGSTNKIMKELVPYQLDLRDGLLY